MRRSLAVVVLLVLAGVLAWLAPWSALRPAPAPTPCVRTVEAPWATEDEWLAGEVLRDLAEMTAWARDAARYRPPQVGVGVRPAPAGATALQLDVDLGLGPGKRVVDLRHYVWSPEDYAPVAGALLATASLAATPPSEDPGLPGTLTNARAEVLAQADVSVSARLGRSLLDAGAHEDAALVLGAFALREAAGSFTDVRRLLCRLSAHLALAQALRSGAAPSRAGRLAGATLLVLAARGADAATAVDALATDADPAARAWTRALALRLDEDWREPPQKASLLERVARFRARAATVDQAQALQDLDRSGRADEAELPDWGRIAMHPLPKVPSGHRFIGTGLDLEVRELQRARQAFGLPALADDEVVSAVNVPAQRCITTTGPRVLGFGAFAAAFQRQAAFWFVMTDYFYRYGLGLPREADAARVALEGRLARLESLPTALVRAARSSPDRAAQADVATRAVKQPEALTARVWAALEGTNSGGCRNPDPRAWFPRACPFGTTHDLVHREFLFQQGAQADRMSAVSPRDYELLALRLKRGVTHAKSVSAVAELFGKRTAYDTRVVWYAAVVPATAEERLEHRRKLCELTAEYCTWLGDELVARGHDAEAAVAFQRALDESLDPVPVSHSLPFLARFYDQHGQPRKAREVAASAASVGSYGGLKTLARWFERHGDLAQAQAWYQGIQERYDATDRVSPPLLGFYYRADHVLHDQRYAGRFEAATKELFPGGLQAFGEAERARPPARGLRLEREGWRTLYHEGLRAIDLIVAVDGWSVADVDQFDVIMELDDAPEVGIVVWRHGRYLDFPLRLANREFEVGLRPYTAPAAARP